MEGCLMMMKKVLITIMSLLMLAAGVHVSAADMYQWVDEDGTVHIEDGLPEDLSKTTKVQKIKLRESKPQIDGSQEAGPEKEAVSKQTATANPTVEIYTTSWCPYCKQAKKYLSDKGIEFTEYDVEVNKEASKRKNDLSPKSGVPVAVINGKVVKGFSADAYDRTFSQLP